MANAGAELDIREATLIDSSIDSFHAGGFEALQPTSGGHRSGMDALLLAACVPDVDRGIVADLGAGAGVAGFAALNLNPNLELVTAEIDPDLANLQVESLGLTANRHFDDRVTVLTADVTKTGTARLETGLTDNMVDHVIMNPPYNSPNYRKPTDASKTVAHIMAEGGLDAWFRTAAAITRPGGTFSVIYRTENLPTILACAQGRFGGLAILPIHSRANEPAKRVIVKALRGSRAPMTIVPGLVIHNDDGSFTPIADAVFKGKQRLEFC